MGEFWGGCIWGFTFGALFGAVMVGSIWMRHFLRTYKEHFEMAKRNIGLNERLTAITETLHEDEIRARRDDIDKTQKLIRASGSISR